MSDDGCVLTRNGWLFQGLDGMLYAAEYDPRMLSCYNSDYDNGWTVDRFRCEWWGQAFPPQEHDQGCNACGYSDCQGGCHA